MKRASKPAEPGVSNPGFQNPLTKTELRTIAKARLAVFSQKDFSAAGEEAARRLPHISGWEEFRSVLAFTPMKDEIDTRFALNAAIAAGKGWFVPDREGRHIFRRMDGLPGILGAEDFPALILTPGLAFDRSGRRLGRGGGWYDRFFAALDNGQLAEGSQTAQANLAYTALGFCMDCQLVDKVPIERWDKTMDGIVTEKLTLFPF